MVKLTQIYRIAYSSHYIVGLKSSHLGNEKMTMPNMKITFFVPLLPLTSVIIPQITPFFTC
jgi:hypothetical protein